MPEGSLKPEDVARLDPYKKRQESVSSEAEELLSGVKQTPESSEDLDEIRRFSKETRRALEEKGFVIYELTGQSIASLREQGNHFWSTWHEKHPEFEALTSIKSEVAINPNELFIEGSSFKTISEQEAKLKISGAVFSRLVPGTEVIMGEAPDYIELAFKSPPDERLFGEKYDYNYTSTKTRIRGEVVIVGDFDPDGGLYVSYWSPDARDGGLRAAPLVVPVGSK